jgi:hypothetical protein
MRVLLFLVLALVQGKIGEKEGAEDALQDETVTDVLELEQKIAEVKKKANAEVKRLEKKLGEAKRAELGAAEHVQVKKHKASTPAAAGLDGSKLDPASQAQFCDGVDDKMLCKLNYLSTSLDTATAENPLRLWAAIAAFNLQSEDYVSPLNLYTLRPLF